jgi:hypothetical protein
MHLCVEKSAAFYFAMWSLNEVETGDVAKKHFSVSLCTYVNLCIYVSKNQRSILRCGDIVMWRYCDVVMLRSIENNILV